MDRSTKMILALIAAGLWANAMSPLFKISPAAAQDEEMATNIAQMASDISEMEGEIDKISRGTCLNSKLC